MNDDHSKDMVETLTREQIEELRSGLCRDMCLPAAVRTEIAILCDMALRAETAARDAERYRWLRQSKYLATASCWLLPTEAPLPETSEEFDAALDAAMREPK